MVKTTLTVVLDVPEFDGQSVDEIRQNLFDSYVNFVTCEHLTAALKWCVLAKIGQEDEDETASQLYRYHNTWADITQQAVWDVHFEN
jgi:hypothetical protein